MRPGDRQLASNLKRKLSSFCQEQTELRGLAKKCAFDSYVEQLVESVRRTKYAEVLSNRKMCCEVADPQNEAFNPIKAAIFQRDANNIEESFWLVFLFTHFGKHVSDGFLTIRTVYGGLGQKIWSWSEVSSEPKEFSKFLADSYNELSELKFGNHRKYETLNPDRNLWTGSIVVSYVDWVGPSRSHEVLFARASECRNAEAAFESLFSSMDKVKRFGRTAKFDYLTMVNKLGLADVVAGSPHIKNSTGPLKGTRLLVDNNLDSGMSPADAEAIVKSLGKYLGVTMQEMEDSICNWQKSPTEFIPFRA